MVLINASIYATRVLLALNLNAWGRGRFGLLFINDIYIYIYIVAAKKKEKKRKKAHGVIYIYI